MTHPINPDGDVTVTDDEILNEFERRAIGVPLRIAGVPNLDGVRIIEGVHALLSATQPAAVDREAVTTYCPSQFGKQPHAFNHQKCGYCGVAAPLYKDAASPPAPSVEQDKRGAFDIALDTLDDYQRNWDTGLPAEYASSERIAMECAVEAVREALTEARAASTSANVAQGQSIDLPPRVIDQLYQAAGVSTYHPDGDQQEKLHAFARGVAAETLARLPAANVAQGEEASFECTHYDAFTEAHKQVAVEVEALREMLGIKTAPPTPTALTDEQIIERCKAAGIKWIAPEPDDEEAGGFPGMFDMATMDEMRAALTAAQSASGLQEDA